MIMKQYSFDLKPSSKTSNKRVTPDTYKPACPFNKLLQIIKDLNQKFKKEVVYFGIKKPKRKPPLS